MSLTNNDWNWRLVAAAAINENQVVAIDSNGKVNTVSNLGGTVPACGIVPQAVLSGARAPVIRGGTIGGLTGFNAGDRLRAQADSTLATAGTTAVLAIVKSEDTSTAVICSANFDH